jgi:hypothetical protein
MALQMNEPLTGYLAELCTDTTGKGAVSGLDAIDGEKVHPILQMTAARSSPLGRLASIKAPSGPSLGGLSC